MALQQDAQRVQVFAVESVPVRILRADSRRFLSLLLRCDPGPLLSLWPSCSCPEMTCSQEWQPRQPRNCVCSGDCSFPDVCFSLHPWTVLEPHLSQCAPVPRANFTSPLCLLPASFQLLCWLREKATSWSVRAGLASGTLRKGCAGVSDAATQTLQTGLCF